MNLAGSVPRSWIRKLCLDLGLDADKVASIMIAPTEIVASMGPNADSKRIFIVVEEEEYI